MWYMYMYLFNKIGGMFPIANTAANLQSTLKVLQLLWNLCLWLSNSKVVQINGHYS